MPRSLANRPTPASDSSDAEEELVAHVLVCQATGEQRQDLRLASGQGAERPSGWLPGCQAARTRVAIPGGSTISLRPTAMSPRTRLGGSISLDRQPSAPPRTSPTMSSRIEKEPHPRSGSRGGQLSGRLGARGGDVDEDRGRATRSGEGRHGSGHRCGSGEGDARLPIEQRDLRRGTDGGGAHNDDGR